MPPKKPAHATDISEREWRLLHRKPVGRVPDDARARLTHRLTQFAQGPKFRKHVSEVTITFRGGYAYVTALGNDQQPREQMAWLDDDQYADYLKDPYRLCRLGWLGDHDRWLFHFWKYSDEKYEPSFLPSGECDGTPEDAFDCAGTVYLLM